MSLLGRETACAKALRPLCSGTLTLRRPTYLEQSWGSRCGSLDLKLLCRPWGLGPFPSQGRNQIYWLLFFCWLINLHLLGPGMFQRFVGPWNQNDGNVGHCGLLRS